jgi:hypothetical protein
LGIVVKAIGQENRRLGTSKVVIDNVGLEKVQETLAIALLHIG